MSADSPRRSGSRVTRQSGGVGAGTGQVVVPQPVTDPSIIDSVTGFINEVVPQAYTSTLPGDFKETITWARFESADINDPSLFPDGSSDTTLPLLLVLGYNSGVQVWSIPANGEATEVLSWSQGSVRTLRILPSPASVGRHADAFASKRPLVAICDSAGPGPPFCSVSFISLKTGDQVKSIKFKNPVCDVVANRRSVVITFLERIAVFDACTLEDRLSVTSCYPSPGPNCNPVSLGSRWLAFAEKKLVAWQRSSGTIGGVGAQSYTATVLHAAQTLGRGLRGLSETVASSLTGPRNSISGQAGVGLLGSSPPTVNGADHNTPGIVTLIDLEQGSSSRHNGTDDGSGSASSSLGTTADGVIAHFIAHNEAIMALQFDTSGMLLLTADKRGHDFHVFRIHPHPGGSSLAAIHHLYVLHRGDTTAKVQDVSFSCDSRWVAVSTMRGTTHVFPLTPYGGPVGVRTHGSPHVVNRLSRFHRSAGLSADGRSSPVPSPESPPCLPAGPHANPRLPPYPHATVQAPLAQLRQSPHPPLASSGALDVCLRVCATFAPPRAWLLDSHAAHVRDGPRDTTKVLRRAVDSLFIMACHGNLVQYDLEPKPVTLVPREKICDDTFIELEVEARAQWLLQRSPHSPEVLPPLPSANPLLACPDSRLPSRDWDDSTQSEERWLSQVEIVTHAGPHRRLWMGPQITFKTYTSTGSGSYMWLQDVEAVEVGTVPVSRPARSNPMNMPAGARPVVPVLIESGSGSSFEQTPHLLEVYGADSGEADSWAGRGDSRLREDLADAMLESPGVPAREKGLRRCNGFVGGSAGEVGEGRVVCGGGFGPIRRVVNPGGLEITMSSDGEEPLMEHEDIPEYHWEAIAIPATAPIIPIPPTSSSIPRESVTTIAAAELIVKTPPGSSSKKTGSAAGVSRQDLGISGLKESCDKASSNAGRKSSVDITGGSAVQKEVNFDKEISSSTIVEKLAVKVVSTKERSVEKEMCKLVKGKEGSVERELVRKDQKGSKGKKKTELGRLCADQSVSSTGSGDCRIKKATGNRESGNELKSDMDFPAKLKVEDDVSTHLGLNVSQTSETKSGRKTRVTPDRDVSEPAEAFPEESKKAFDSVESSVNVKSEKRKSPKKESVVCGNTSKVTKKAPSGSEDNDGLFSFKKGKKNSTIMSFDSDSVVVASVGQSESSKPDFPSSSGRKSSKEEYVSATPAVPQKDKNSSELEKEIEDAAEDIKVSVKKLKIDEISKTASKSKKRLPKFEYETTDCQTYDVDDLTKVECEITECPTHDDDDFMDAQVNDALSSSLCVESELNGSQKDVDFDSMEAAFVSSEDIAQNEENLSEDCVEQDLIESISLNNEIVELCEEESTDSISENPKKGLERASQETTRVGKDYSAPLLIADKKVWKDEQNVESIINIPEWSGLKNKRKGSVKTAEEAGTLVAETKKGKRGSLVHMEMDSSANDPVDTISRTGKKAGKALQEAELTAFENTITSFKGLKKKEKHSMEMESSLTGIKTQMKGIRSAIESESLDIEVVATLSRAGRKGLKNSDQTELLVKDQAISERKIANKGSVGANGNFPNISNSDENFDTENQEDVLTVVVEAVGGMAPVNKSSRKGKKLGLEQNNSNEQDSLNAVEEKSYATSVKKVIKSDNLPTELTNTVMESEEISTEVGRMDFESTHDNRTVKSKEGSPEKIQKINKKTTKLLKAAEEVIESSLQNTKLSKRAIRKDEGADDGNSSKITTKGWNIEKETESGKEVDDFPALPSKKSADFGMSVRSVWNITQEASAESTFETTPNAWGMTGITSVLPHNTEKQLPRKSKKNMDLHKLSSTNEPLSTSEEIREEVTVKPKRGWELPTSTDTGIPQAKSHKSKGRELSQVIPPPDVDIDKLTFEDLEAIVDAACKEEEVKAEQSYLQENKSGKKADGNNPSSSKKIKGKENVDGEIQPDSQSSEQTVSEPEVPELSKTIEEVIKHEEPAKSPEKVSSTHSKGSKSQRRKGRR